MVLRSEFLVCHQCPYRARNLTLDMWNWPSLAYFDSNENVLWVEAGLNRCIVSFDKNCRLTGGFALVSWFNRGEFLLSLGGYHPKFKAPSYYPTVQRLGLNWKPFQNSPSKAKRTSQSVLRHVLGGALSATYKAGRLVLLLMQASTSWLSLIRFTTVLISILGLLSAIKLDGRHSRRV